MTKLVNVIDAWVRILGENRLALIVLAVYLVALKVMNALI